MRQYGRIVTELDLFEALEIMCKDKGRVYFIERNDEMVYEVDQDERIRIAYNDLNRAEEIFAILKEGGADELKGVISKG